MNIKKMLIANRGEIAIRIMRSARELGIKSVAVYSEADRASKHIKYADEAYFIGEAAAAESYLNITKLISAAKKSNCDAVHPGYGFLAENADFAESVINEKILWIGPSPSVVRLSGNKIEARRLAEQAGAPITPGAVIDDERDIRQIAEKIGFPVLIKAAAGGGGKGMHIANNKQELESALRMGRSEAKSSFGDDTVYIEKLLKSPRHIEIQLLLDQYGNGVYFPERECSIQRRYQKVIEETPSTAISRQMAAKLGETALSIAKKIGYHTAGTAEFLVDNGEFYFLEINARIQVEHPITEALTGMDLVSKQIELASGSMLNLTQNEIRSNGHAIEARIYAEDPYGNFAPSPGKIDYYNEPSMPGIRCDSGIDVGTVVSVYYDPILAKIISYAENRKKAIARLSGALSEYHIAPNKTAISFLKSIITHEDFLKGDYDTKFLDKNKDVLLKTTEDKIFDAVAIYYLTKHRQLHASTRENTIDLCWDSLGEWRG
ncbi:MAG: acetyl-CoA carboxylase biotin carboxylase subunit [Epsilonproteobacteria bacterium]|nr:acetyl-CoA carboxylase biotin carboxylase subunit [Campylobacterota bacterium]